MGRPALADDPRYASHAARGRHQKALDALIETWTSTLTVDAVEELMRVHAVPAGRIFRAADMMSDPHIKARDALLTFPDHPRWPGLTMQNTFPKLSDTPGSVRSLAPQQVGQDNAEIFGGRLGLSEQALRALAERGVI